MKRSSLPALLALASCAAPGPRQSAEGVVWIEAPAPTPAAQADAPAPGPRRADPLPRDGPEPRHFWLLSQGEEAERREWVRVDRRTWEERYPSGAVMRYRVVGRIREGARVGVLARRLPDSDMDVFVPDLGGLAFPAMRVAPDGDWHDLGPIHLIE